MYREREREKKSYEREIMERQRPRGQQVRSRGAAELSSKRPRLRCTRSLRASENIQGRLVSKFGSEPTAAPPRCLRCRRPLGQDAGRAPPNVAGLGNRQHMYIYIYIYIYNR